MGLTSCSPMEELGLPQTQVRAPLPEGQGRMEMGAAPRITSMPVKVGGTLRTPCKAPQVQHHCKMWDVGRKGGDNPCPPLGAGESRWGGPWGQTDSSSSSSWMAERALLETGGVQASGACTGTGGGGAFGWGCHTQTQAGSREGLGVPWGDPCRCCPCSAPVKYPSAAPLLAAHSNGTLSTSG